VSAAKQSELRVRLREGQRLGGTMWGGGSLVVLDAARAMRLIALGLAERVSDGPNFRVVDRLARSEGEHRYQAIGSWVPMRPVR
jgi:hypothetical protein